MKREGEGGEGREGEGREGEGGAEREGERKEGGKREGGEGGGRSEERGEEKSVRTNQRIRRCPWQLSPSQPLQERLDYRYTIDCHGDSVYLHSS